MTGFDQLTSIRGENGEYETELTHQMVLWSVNGGYMAAIALRVAGEFSRCRIPLNITSQFLKAAEIGGAHVSAKTLVSGEQAELIEVSISQNDKTVLLSHVWIGELLDSPSHNFAQMPLVASPKELRSLEEVMSDDEPDMPVFLKNFDQKPIFRNTDERIKLQPVALRWFRYRGGSSFDCPFLDNARTLPLIDYTWYLAVLPIHENDFTVITPTISLSVHFVDRAPNSEWLLADIKCESMGNGLIESTTRIWSESGQLIAEGIAQMMKTRGNARDLAFT